MDEKVRAAIENLEKRGHTVTRCLLDGKACYLIDETRVKPSEIRELADGIYSWEELEKDLLERRRAEEQSASS